MRHKNVIMSERPLRPSLLASVRDRTAALFGVTPEDRRSTVASMLGTPRRSRAGYWLQLVLAMAGPHVPEPARSRDRPREPRPGPRSGSRSCRRYASPATAWARRRRRSPRCSSPRTSARSCIEGRTVLVIMIDRKRAGSRRSASDARARDRRLLPASSRRRSSIGHRSRPDQRGRRGRDRVARARVGGARVRTTRTARRPARSCVRRGAVGHRSPCRRRGRRD